MLTKNIKHVLAVAMLSSIATLAYAEDAAPVYDVDNFPPQFDSQIEGAPSAASVSANDTAPPAIDPTLTNASLPMSTDQRVARVERQINNLQQKDLSGKIETLQNDLQSLRGQVEQMTHQQQKQANAKPDSASDTQALRAQVNQLTQQVQQLQNQLAKTNSNKTTSDMSVEDNAIPAEPKTASVAPVRSKAKTSATTQTTALAAPTKAKTSASDDAANIDVAASPQQPNVAEEQQIYQTAYDLIKAKKYNEAIAALQRMLKKYPTGQFAANAHYWLGELYGLLGKNDQSAVEFDKVTTEFPDSPKVADAQLKLGLIYSAQFKWPDSKAAFKKVINHYPGTASARLAAEQLKQIKEAGH